MDGRGRLKLRALLLVPLLAYVALDSAHAQIVAAGQNLTVTTTNCVATFKRADLTGFTNVLTGEAYLNLPTSTALANLETITATGLPLEASNWVLSPAPGGGTVATLTMADSIRTLVMTVRVDAASQEVVVRVSGGASKPGIRNVSWTLAGLDLAKGRLAVAALSGIVFDKEHPGIGVALQYPFSWDSQAAVFESARGGWIIYSTDTSFQFKQLRVSSRSASMLDVALLTEAPAPWPSATAVPATEWRLKAFSGDWRTGAQTYRDWLVTNRPPVADGPRAWVRNIRTVVRLQPLDAGLLDQLAALFVPSRTLLYLPDWRQFGYDVNYPDYTPRGGVAEFVSKAQSLGFRVMLHANLFGVSPGNPDYGPLQLSQVKDSESLQPQGWYWDRAVSTPQRFAYISPASSAFRKVLIARLTTTVNTVHPDAIHLDQSVLAINDGNGLIEGMTLPQGVVQLHRELHEAFPGVAFGGEGMNDVVYGYHAFAQSWWQNLPGDPHGHPISNYLLGGQVQYYGHLSQPPASDPGFLPFLQRTERRGTLPTLAVWSTADLDITKPENARLISLLQSWQSNGFRPAWSADWTGALIRYEGSGGSSAALTDSGSLLRLDAAGASLYQRLHDVNHAETTSFVRHWPAFDAARIYGLDPDLQYWAESLPRPNTTRISSLPPGIKLGAETMITSKFAYVEVEPVSQFHFLNNLWLARSGVSFLGVDGPLANGATANEATVQAGGVARQGIFIHPPWQGQVGGEGFVEYAIAAPSNTQFSFSVGVADDAACTDGVTFRVLVNGQEKWRQHVVRTGWMPGTVDLSALGGTTLQLRLVTNPGAAKNPNCDWAAFSQLALVPASSSVSVPLALGAGASFSGFSGEGSYSASGAGAATVSGTALPGRFVVFLTGASSVAAGSSLLSLPFESWIGSGKYLPLPGQVFGSGTIGPATAGGVTKTSTVSAHPPDHGRTVLSWALRLPDSGALRFSWSAGIADGGFTDSGVMFVVRINGLPYWTLFSKENVWRQGSIDLARWRGQHILLQLVADSAGNYSSDWARWADLTFSAADTVCTYAIPSGQSFTGSAGSSSLAVAAEPGCPWSAASNMPWISIQAPGSGMGAGSVSFTVALNHGAARSGTISVGGKIFTVTQEAGLAPGCTGALASNSLSAPQTGVKGTVNLTIGDSCAWVGSSNQPWAQIFPISWTGPRAVEYTVFPNFSTKTRTAILNAALQPFVITQPGSAEIEIRRFVRQMYFNFFGRLPSESEVDFNVNALNTGLVTRVQLVSNFFNSAEFNNAGRFIAGLYVGILNRNAEYGGWLFIRNALSTAAVQYTDLVHNFIESAEFKLNNPSLTNRQFAALMYQQILLRAGTSAELDFMESALAGGLSRAQFATNFLQSAEFRAGTGPRLTTFVLYACLLQRDPSNTEYTNVIASLLPPSSTPVATVIDTILKSPEFAALFL